MIKEVQKFPGTRPYDKDMFIVYSDGYKVKRKYFGDHLPKGVVTFMSKAKETYEPIGGYTSYMMDG